MKPIHSFPVVPRLPSPLERLRELACNMNWSWNHDTIELFRRIDSDLWESCGHNPTLMLGAVDQARLDAIAADESFLAQLERVCSAFDLYVAGGSTWFRRTHGAGHSPLVAYFSAEFGITECLSIFAGGLGVLAGDHLKSASDLGIPLVGVGLLYQQGYFRQYLNSAGWQQEAYEDNDFHNLPLALERGPGGKPLLVQIAYPGGTVAARVWRVRVGRVMLYLLDTNIAVNARAEDRDITDQLYGGDLETRIRQEILLGVGGFRALQALGIRPTVCHMNEGHSAFVSLELTRWLMETHRMSFVEARQLASASLVFTTHTPVEAGHDYFPTHLMDRYFSDYIARLGLSRSEFLGLGRRQPADDNENFCMTILALRMAAFSNGVSRLHGQVSRRMWHGIWPGITEEETPVGHVTNGVHYRSWISLEMNQLYDRYLGANWHDQPAEPGVWRRVDAIPAEELWRTHERRRERLVAFARRRLREQLKRRSALQSEIDTADEVLDPDALTIGFARRFATYKRATLLLRDQDRLARILNNPERPVQIIFAGKAHPRDDAGKDLIRHIASVARQPAFRRRIVFIEGYDMSVARYLVQGVDVWLNSPLRPNEASGTSGMKALANGALNVSTLDGWWDEAWQIGVQRSDPVGWAIGKGEVYENRDYQDQVEADALYELLERDIVPAFYDRKADRIPRRWIARMKASIGSLCHFFNTHRMVRDYTERFYLVANTNVSRLLDNNAAQARSLAAWLERVRASWPQIRIEVLEPELPPQVTVGQGVAFRARVSMGPLRPEDLRVELYIGRMNSAGDIVDSRSTVMEPLRQEQAGTYLYETRGMSCHISGLHGYTARVLPYHPELNAAFIPGLITWATAEARAAGA